jgi:hypothetical protein
MSHPTMFPAENMRNDSTLPVEPSTSHKLALTSVGRESKSLESNHSWS